MSTTPDNKEKVRLDESKGLDFVESDGENLFLMSQTANLSSDVVKSEVNFLVLPFFALWDKDVRKRTKTEYRAVIKRGKEKLEIVWTVLAQPEFGYPSPFDKSVHKAVEQLISELPRPIENPIPLGSFHGLYKRMGFDKVGGSQYKKIKEAFARITTTSIKSEGAFFSKEKEEWIEDIFHLYDRVIFKGRKLQNGEIADTNYLYLNSWYLDNINANYVKPIDWDYYNSLETPLAQRFYELLSVKFYGVIMRRGKELSYRYSTLCDLLPANRQQYLSFAQRIFDPAHEKLKETGFLADYDWGETTPKTKGDWLITYSVGSRAREEVRKAKTYFKSPQLELEFEAEALPDPKRKPLESEEELEPLTEEQTELLEKLVELNVTRSVADDLIRHFDNEIIQKWTDAIQYADARDKAAYLVDAVRRDWALPEKWLKAKDSEERESEMAKVKQVEEEKKEEEKARKRKEAERLDNIYNSLSDEQRQEVDAEAEKRLPFFARERLMEGQTDSPILIASLKTNREEILKEWIEAGKIDSSG